MTANHSFEPTYEVLQVRHDRADRRDHEMNATGWLPTGVHPMGAGSR